MGILVTALVALASLFALATDTNATASDLTRAAIFARQKLEELRAPDSPPAIDGREHLDHLDDDGRVLGPLAEPEQAMFSRRWRVEPVPGAPPGTSLVRVEVTRAAAVRRQRVVSMAGVRRSGP